MTNTERGPATVAIVVDEFVGDGDEISDHVIARLSIDDVPSHKVTFHLSHLDFMRGNPPTDDDEVAEMWDVALEEMSARLAAELTYAGLLRFDNPINVQSHLTSFRRTGSERSGLRTPGTVLVSFGV